MTYSISGIWALGAAEFKPQTLDSCIGDHTLIEKVKTIQLAAIACPRSRYYGHLPRKLIDLNSSMSSLARWQQLTL
jgi:hypothetical protein